ncbi:hypothetical protein Tco_0500921 [Tanacetum coccineum]
MARLWDLRTLRRAAFSSSFKSLAIMTATSRRLLENAYQIGWKFLEFNLGVHYGRHSSAYDLFSDLNGQLVLKVMQVGVSNSGRDSCSPYSNKAWINAAPRSAMRACSNPRKLHGIRIRLQLFPCAFHHFFLMEMELMLYEQVNKLEQQQEQHWAQDLDYETEFEQTGGWSLRASLFAGGHVVLSLVFMINCFSRPFSM